MNSPSICALEDLGVLAIAGPDAVRFLQGQLSNDVTQLTAAPLRAGLHNPQGRTLALLMLLSVKPDTLLAVLPRDLLAATRGTLQRYVLRAQVRLSDASEAWRLYGAWPGAFVPQNASAATLVAPWEGQRRLLLVPADEPTPPGPNDSKDSKDSNDPSARAARAAWRAADIAAGLPQVYAATAGQFVAQMLNLDCIGALSFQKGCYTGQEVIARAHYRGRVKRRLQRFLSETACTLAPGEAGTLADGRAFRVVEASAREDGRCEFLAVAALPGESETSAETAASADEAAATTVLRASVLPLPYPLPA